MLKLQFKVGKPIASKLSLVVGGVSSEADPPPSPACAAEQIAHLSAASTELLRVATRVNIATQAETERGHALSPTNEPMGLQRSSIETVDGGFPSLLHLLRSLASPIQVCTIEWKSALRFSMCCRPSIQALNKFFTPPAMERDYLTSSTTQPAALLSVCRSEQARSSLSGVVALALAVNHRFLQLSWNGVYIMWIRGAPDGKCCGERALGYYLCHGTIATSATPLPPLLLTFHYHFLCRVGFIPVECVIKHIVTPWPSSSPDVRDGRVHLQEDMAERPPITGRVGCFL